MHYKRGAYKQMLKAGTRQRFLKVVFCVFCKKDQTDFRRPRLQNSGIDMKYKIEKLSDQVFQPHIDFEPF